MGSSHEGTWSPGPVAGTSPIVCADLNVFIFGYVTWVVTILFLLIFYKIKMSLTRGGLPCSSAEKGYWEKDT